MSISEEQVHINDGEKRQEQIPLDQEKKPKNLNGSFTPYLMLSISIAVFGASFQQGFQIGLFNIPEKVIKDFIQDTNSKADITWIWTLINAALPFGGVFGSLISGYVADRFGRKGGMLLINIIVLISASILLISKFIPSYVTIIIARALAGFYSGLFTGSLPIFLNEISPSNLRGAAGTVNQLLVVLGILTANVMGLKQLLGTSELWPVLTSGIFFGAAINLCLFFVYESPKFLYRKNVELGRKALTKYRGAANKALIDDELESYEEEKIQLANQKAVSWVDFYRLDYLRRPLVVTIVIQLSQQFSGINAVMNFSTEIFKNAGIEEEMAMYCSIILNVINLLMTFVCLAVIDRLGRRILLLLGMVGMCFSSVGLALFMTLNNRFKDNTALSYTAVIFAVLYIMFFAIGPGAIPWLITSELFDSSARGKATSIACFANWGGNLLVVAVYPSILAAIGTYSFFVFAVLLVFFALFTIFFIPETKNRSIEEIKDLFKENLTFFDRKYF